MGLVVFWAGLYMERIHQKATVECEVIDVGRSI
jgi:hypothetical protein